MIGRILLFFQKRITYLTALVNNHFRLAFILSVIGIMLFGLFHADYANEKLVSSMVKVFLLLAVLTLFEKFFNRFNFNVSGKISENSVALALYLGLIAISIGICISVN